MILDCPPAISTYFEQHPGCNVLWILYARAGYVKGWSVERKAGWVKLYRSLPRTVTGALAK